MVASQSHGRVPVGFCIAIAWYIVLQQCMRILGVAVLGIVHALHALGVEALALVEIFAGHIVYCIS